MKFSERREVIAENIQYQMRKKGYARSDLAKEINVPYTTLCDWMKHKTTPRIEKLEEMAERFGCSISDLIEPHDRNGADAAPIKIDVLGSINASNNVIGVIYASQDEIPYDINVIGMKIHGDSMAPRFCDGDTVIVQEVKDWRTDLQTGDIVIATVNGDTVCKKLQINEDGMTLEPTNENYQSVPYTQEDIDRFSITIYGKVIGIHGKVE